MNKLFKTLSVVIGLDSPTWFSRDEYGDYSAAVFYGNPVLSSENSVENKNITTSGLKPKNAYDAEELEKIKNDWRLPQNMAGEKAHIPPV